MRSAAASLLLLVAACASPPVAWPPAPGTPTARIVVSMDAWHSMVAVERPEGALEEWGFAERAWYLEGRQGPGGVVRALFWPTEGVIEVAQVDRPYGDRSPEGGRRRWTIEVSEEGLARMKQYFESSLASRDVLRDDGWRRWHPASSSYHLFFNCHHWTAGALWEAGVPVRSWACWLPHGLEVQMDRLSEGSRSE